MNKQRVAADLKADITIVGAGIVGLTLAALLEEHTEFSVLVVDRASQEELLQNPVALTERVSAVNSLSTEIWEKLGIWHELLSQAQAYHQMHVWDYFGGQLNFDLKQPDAVLGYIVTNRLVQQALLTKLLKASEDNKQIRFCLGVECKEISYPTTGVRHLVEKNGQCIVIDSDYLIAADGASSWVRSHLGVKLSSWSYGHTAIIANVTTEKSHNHTAWQKFTESGPLAFLPVASEQDGMRKSSIVWSVTEEKMQSLLSLTDEDFMQILAAEFEYRLGAVLSVSSRQSYPLKMRHVKQYLINKNTILVGDAAHTVHPLAGQGLNLAMQDVRSLVKIFMRHDMGYSSFRAFERERKAEVWQMIAGLELIKRAYAVKSPLLQSLVHFGINQIEQHDFLKNYFINIALSQERN